MKCSFCGADITADKVFRTTICPSCGRDAKVCKNCRFYDPDAHWQCRETIPEPVSDKEIANFCAYFSPKDVADVTEQEEKRRRARKALDDLFG
ncbi:hypothetical protein WKV44_05005 [Spirochaetia bacterium 38H-sp]|uniref:Uncharacterized protein n=1 Tax=Rarispira pelagica TaxID=3141764 RepID=A0ABU9UBR8_9SPIR